MPRHVFISLRFSIWRSLTSYTGNWLRTITSDQTVYNNSSLSFWTLSVWHRWIEIIEKFIICMAWVIFKYTENRENIAIFGQNILDVRATSFQRKRLTRTLAQVEIRGFFSLRKDVPKGVCIYTCVPMVQNAPQVVHCVLTISH